MMKQLFLFILLIGFVTCSQAQVEFSNKFKGIPPVNIKPKPEKKYIPPADPNAPAIIPPNIYKNPNAIQSPPNPVDDYKVKTKSEMSMIPKDEFMNPGDEVRDRLNKKTDRQEGLAYRRNQNLGTFKSTADAATVMYRDAQYVDGDLIRVWVNRVIIQSSVYLDSNFKGFEVTLKKVFNKIDFEALNQGDLSLILPNLKSMMIKNN